MATRTETLSAEIADLQRTTRELDTLISQKGPEAQFQGFGAQGVKDDIQKRIAGRQAELAREQQVQQTTSGRIEEGLKLGKGLIGEGSLGRATTSTALGRATGSTALERVDTEAVRQGRSTDINDVIQRRRAALSGLSSEEMQASRDIAAEQIGRQSETQRRQLQAIQSRTGVRGGTAAAQQAQVLQQATKTRAEFERDIFLENQKIKREALTAFESSVSAAEQSEAQRQLARADLLKFNAGQQASERQLQLQQERFNIGQQNTEQQLSAQQEIFNLQQAAKERFGQVSTALGYASLISGDVAADKAAAAQTAAAAAQGSGGK